MTAIALGGAEFGGVYKVPEVAKLLSVSPRTISRLIAAGALNAIRVGVRSTRILAAEVERYVQRQAGVRGQV